MSRMILLFFSIVFSLSSVSAAEREAMGSGRSLVYSCTIIFPNDSDVFHADRIRQCIKDINPLQVSYVHVVATATTTGTAEHNLDLSNRRASAVGDFITRSFPNVRDVHIFGGGQNPRLGRQARVFIVVQPEHMSEEPDSLEPQVIHEVEVRTEVQTLTLTRSRRALEAVAQYGLADVEHYEFKHRYLSFGIRRPSLWNNRADIAWNFGLHLSQYQSTLRRDFEALHLEAGVKKVWTVSRVGGVFAQVSALAGGSTNHEKLAADFGLRLESGWENDGLRVGLAYSHAYQLKQLGILIGIDF